MAGGALSTWSLWLEPKEPAKSTLHNIIKSLSSSSPTSATFGPHATLYGHIDISIPLPEVRYHVKQIIAKRPATGPLRLSLLPPQTGNTFFQCILAPVTLTDDLGWMKDACDHVWGHPKPFFPHISLKYGDINEGLREEIATEARKEEIPAEVVVKGISIVRCVGPSDEWEVVDFVPFK